MEELPSEEAEILQVGFTNSLIDKIEDITGEIVKMSKELLDFKIHPIIENNNFFILSYKKRWENRKRTFNIKRRSPYQC